MLRWAMVVALLGVTALVVMTGIRTARLADLAPFSPVHPVAPIVRSLPRPAPSHVAVAPLPQMGATPVPMVGADD